MRTPGPSAKRQSVELRSLTQLARGKSSDDVAASPALGSDGGAQPSERNKAELAAVLASDIFKRSPKLSGLLVYLCEKCFQGLAQEITEFGIGLDALGRDPSFDPQRDSLVRVDTHQLRKRLKQYYESEGRGHEVRIVLPGGHYVPQFVPQAELGPSENKDSNGAEAPPDQPQAATASQAPNGIKAKLAWVAGAALLFSVCWWLVAAGQGSAARRGAAPVPAAPLIANGDEAVIRIAAGDRHGDYSDKLGRVWSSDRFFRGGAIFRRGPVAIQRTLDPELFWSGREGQFVYNIPLSPGTYELHLYFAETGAESQRSVSMAINSLPVPAVDVASDADGVNTATVKIFKDISPADDGALHLTFLGRSFLNALEIFPSARGKMRPVRLITRDTVYRDRLGQIWMPDEYGIGARRRHIPGAQVEGSSDSGLYQSYRVGHFNYSIPVIEGMRYTVKLYFSEPFFTQARPESGIGSRVFDVYCDGITLLKGFDIVKEARGGNRALVRIFHGIPASPQGKIDLNFVPVANYALINAIEIVAE